MEVNLKNYFWCKNIVLYLNNYVEEFIINIKITKITQQQNTITTIALVMWNFCKKNYPGNLNYSKMFVSISLLCCMWILI